MSHLLQQSGRIGEMREMHTQAPVVYLDFEGGRMKMLGSIVRPKSTRYFTLNAKSKDRMNLEEWFESVIVFPSWYWIGTKEENPEEKPLAGPQAEPQAWPQAQHDLAPGPRPPHQKKTPA